MLTKLSSHSGKTCLLSQGLKLIRTDGLLHFLVNYATVLTFTLFDPALIAGPVVAVFLSAFKECYDVSNFKKAGTEVAVIRKETIHDAIFDILGILAGAGVCLLAR